MNLVGKIFTVLIFLMCVVFGTFALMVHAAHKNWREAVVAKGGLKEQLDEANKLNRELTDDKKILETALDNEKKDKRDRLTALENEKNIVVGERDDYDRRLQIVEGESQKLALAIKETSQRLGVLQTAIDGMRNDIKVAVDERNNTQKNLVDTTDKLMNAVAERERLEKLQRELLAQIVKIKEVLQYAKVTANDMARNPPEGLEGEVTSVPRPDVVEISLGADDGVRVGHRFSVIRPSTNKYVGMIDVVKVDYPNRAVCRPDKQMQNDQIQKGDHVYAKTR